MIRAISVYLGTLLNGIFCGIQGFLVELYDAWDYETYRWRDAIPAAFAELYWEVKGGHSRGVYYAKLELEDWA